MPCFADEFRGKHPAEAAFRAGSVRTTRARIQRASARRAVLAPARPVSETGRTHQTLSRTDAEKGARVYRKPKQGHESEPNPQIASTNGPGDSAPSLDDDPELAHIARFSPPEIEVAPDSKCRVGRDAPPPMIRPTPHEGESQDKPRIEHIAPLGPLADRPGPNPAPVAEPEAPPVEAIAPAPSGGKKKIRAFEQRLGGSAHEDNWQRTPNVTGTGAIHVKSFHCKLTGDSLEFLDMQINEWLDAHPQYEVKQVTTSVGDWSGKTREPALIVNVWV
jgi:hypothetical protein